MTYKPSLPEAAALSAGYKSVPVSREIYSDGTTPVEVMRRLKKVSKRCFILESVEDRTKWGRYTFLGYDPKPEIVSDIKTLRKTLADNASPRVEGLPPFTGGLVGYFSYEFITLTEPDLCLDAAKSDGEEDFKDFDLMIFDKIIAFDNLRQKIILIAAAATADLEEGYRKAVSDIEEMREIITSGSPAKIPTLEILSPFRELFRKDEYVDMVKRVKRYIYDGDIFQAVLSNRLDARARGSLFDAYRVLRTTNPSPYMFYFGSDDIEIAGASPETLVKLTGGKLYTYPLAGTSPRGATDKEDALLEAELLSDEKELSEHNMLVDLGRNDLGKISKFGTVEVENYLHVVKFSHVMHIASAVKGEIRPDKDALDAISAVLPAGTLSGAPKLRACEIIAELERSKRGIYGGALGYIAFNGDMDVCISIRLAYKRNGKVSVRSGAGIVADSVPEREYAECADKAKAVINALLESEGEI
ncbi:MAG: anthranilate synthase component I family protein [Oscillospiraceae bacterium]|nr:anthranilate synthase component I family protein [Oscillospiraceae bacterium]